MSKTSLEVHESWMTDEMTREALQVALLAVNMHEGATEIATYIMREFDRRHGRTWHCIVGICGYGVQPDHKTYICFSVGDKRITIFKSA